jgi:hypothetical protein
MILRLPPEKLAQLRKYFEKNQVRDCEVFAQNNEDNGEEAAQSNEDCGQDDDSDSDTSLEFVVHYGPDDHYQNPPFVWDGRDPVPPVIAQAQAAEVLAPDYNNDLHINVQPNTQIRADFREYCWRGKRFTQSFTKVQARAVRLMAILKRKSAPLTMYSHIMDWFHRENDDINKYQKLQHVLSGYLSRKALITFLEERYNMKGRGPIKQTISLPNSKAKVTITTQNAWHCIESLLTDPRVKDSD